MKAGGFIYVPSSAGYFHGCDATSPCLWGRYLLITGRDGRTDGSGSTPVLSAVLPTYLTWQQQHRYSVRLGRLQVPKALNLITGTQVPDS